MHTPGYALPQHSEPHKPQGLGVSPIEATIVFLHVKHFLVDTAHFSLLASFVHTMRSLSLPALCIGFHPLHRDFLIPNPHIQRLLVFEKWHSCESEDRQAAVERDVYNRCSEAVREGEQVDWVVVQMICVEFRA
jgi:hypothetical protein